MKAASQTGFWRNSDSEELPTAICELEQRGALANSMSSVEERRARLPIAMTGSPNKVTDSVVASNSNQNHLASLRDHHDSANTSLGVPNSNVTGKLCRRGKDLAPRGAPEVTCSSSSTARRIRLTSKTRCLCYGSCGTSRNHRPQIWLRCRDVRCLHSACRRRGDAILLAAGRGRQRRHHHDRWIGHTRGDACRAEGLGKAPGRAMRLLPVRPDHVGRRAVERQRQPERRRHRPGDVGQPVPLWHLSADPRRDQDRGARAQGSAT